MTHPTMANRLPAMTLPSTSLRMTRISRILAARGGLPFVLVALLPAPSRTAPLQVVVGASAHANLYAPLPSEYGRCVASAGDIDGDGVEDFVVGAPGMEGSWPSTQNLGGVHLPGKWTVLGENDGDRFGTSVSGGLRLNAGPAQDVVVGAPLHDGLKPDGGAVYALEGSTGTVLYVVYGTTIGDEFGAVVARVGDVNTDGFDDYLAGAPQAQFDAPGYARLLSGVDGSVIRTHTGSAPGDWFGLALTGLGDVDVDGVPDYAVGAPHEQVVAGQPSGRVRVFSGATGALLRVHDTAVPHEQFGYALGGGTDIDRDGTDDLVVGAPSSTLVGPGRVRTYSGRTGALLDTLVGSEVGDWFGAAVAGVHDFDGDGFGDIVVGAPGQDPRGPWNQPSAGVGYVQAHSGLDGEVLARLGGAFSSDGLGISVAGLASLSGNATSRFVGGGRMWNDGYGVMANVAAVARPTAHQVRPGQGDKSRYGRSVACAGDIDLDGVPDALVGAPDGGYVQVLSGASRETLFDLQGTPPFGRVVCGAGDVDGDGCPDVLVGGVGAKLFSGKTRQVLFSFSDSGVCAVDGGADVDGDGRPDVIVGSGVDVVLNGNMAGNYYGQGRARVYSGASGAPLFTFDGLSAGDALGFSVALLDDLDGDGRAEFMFGAPGDADRVEVRSGLDGSLKHTFSTIDEREGTCVRRLGDLDGDGIDDIAYSAWSPGQLWSFGGIFVHSGADFGPLWLAFGQSPYKGPSLGYSIADAGDYDGDGRDDVLAGMPGDSFGIAAGMGSVHVLSGSNGAAIGPLKLQGYGGWDYFGYSVAGLGDVNADGKPDLLIGAPTDPDNAVQSQESWNRVHWIVSNHLDVFKHCPQAPNSTGLAASIRASGLGNVALDDLRLDVEQAPVGVLGMFIMAQEQALFPFGDGKLCVQGGLKRILPPHLTSPEGTAGAPLSLTTSPGNAIQPGSQWSFQFWYRDPAVKGGTGTNLSDAVRVQFLP